MHLDHHVRLVQHDVDHVPEEREEVLVRVRVPRAVERRGDELVAARHLCVAQLDLAHRQGAALAHSVAQPQPELGRLELQRHVRLVHLAQQLQPADRVLRHVLEQFEPLEQRGHEHWPHLQARRQRPGHVGQVYRLELGAAQHDGRRERVEQARRIAPREGECPQEARVVLRAEVGRRPALNRSADGGERGGRRRARAREGPGDVGERLRLEVSCAVHHLGGNALEEGGREHARRREGPRRVGQLDVREGGELTLLQLALDCTVGALHGLGVHPVLGEGPHQHGNVPRAEVGQARREDDSDRLEQQLRGGGARLRKGPREVGQALRREVAQARLHGDRDRAEELVRLDARGGVGPHHVRKVLRVEAFEVRRRHPRHLVEELTRGVARLCERPDELRQVARAEAAQLRHRLPRERLEKGLALGRLSDGAERPGENCQLARAHPLTA
mmetsp:Transcript_25322/g.64373  ORF Transcript_25322/g.64373 Transcript_25322/m.64373 type:complete len:445 (-) Transcript_25322:150-1484(-)